MSCALQDARAGPLENHQRSNVDSVLAIIDDFDANASENVAWQLDRYWILQWVRMSSSYVRRTPLGRISGDVQRRTALCEGSAFDGPNPGDLLGKSWQ